MSDGFGSGFGGVGQFVADPASIALTPSPSSYKEPARAATTANITLSGAQTIDGVSIIAGDSVLVWNQSTAANNGVYLASAGAWTRRSDFDAPTDLIPGSIIPISEGTLYGNHLFICSTNAPVVVGTTPLVFQDLGTASVAMAVTATPNTGVLRDAFARAQIADPAVAADIDNLGARQAAIDARLSAANATDLTDGGDSTLHYHASDRAYADTAIQNADGAGLTWSAGILDVNVDNSSLEINADTLRVKALGITNAMLAGGIAYSKLNLALSIVNADVAAGAAIAYAKLALGNSVLLADIAAASKSTTSTNDTLAVRTATGQVRVASPLATDDAINLTYFNANAATNAAVGAETGNRAYVRIFDDFFYGQGTVAYPDTIGPWDISRGGANSPTEALTGGAATQMQGYVRLAAPTVAAQFTTIRTQAGIYLGQGIATLEGIFSWDDRPDATNDYDFQFGLSASAAIGSTTAALVNGFAFRVDRAIAADANIYYQVRAANAGAAVSTGTAIPAATPTTSIRLGMTINALATSVEFFVNGVSAGVVSTGLPSVANSFQIFAGVTRNAGASGRQTYVDLIDYKCALTATR